LQIKKLADTCCVSELFQIKKSGLSIRAFLSFLLLAPPIFDVARYSQAQSSSAPLQDALHGRSSDLFLFAPRLPNLGLYPQSVAFVVLSLAGGIYSSEHCLGLGTCDQIALKPAPPVADVPHRVPSSIDHLRYDTADDANVEKKFF
jgi:hypothetical protein